MIASQNSNNLYFVNVAKTLAIFLMALAHLPIPDDLYAFINSFHMPLFFFISGYLLSVDTISFRSFLSKKIRTLLIPYYIFAFITFCFWYFAGRKFGQFTEIDYDISKYITGAIFAIPSKEFMGFNLPIWFLPSLLCTEIIFFGIYRYFKKYSFILCILIFCMGVFLREIHLFRLPYGLDVSFFSVIFLFIGHWARKKDLIDKYILKSPALIFKVLLLIAFSFITIWISKVNGAVLMYQCIFNNYFLFFTGAFSGIIGTLYLSSIFIKTSIFDFYGRNTIVILAFHLMTLSIIKGIQAFLFKIPLELTDEYWTVNILYVFFAFILLAPVIYFVNKYVPFILGRKRGIL